MTHGIHHLSALLATHGLRHHVDDEELVIRIVLPMRRYLSLRREPLAVVRIEITDMGQTCRASIAPGFRPEGSLAAACLAIAGGLIDCSCVAVHHAAGSDTLDLVAAMPFDSASVTADQLCVLIDHLGAAADHVQGCLDRVSPAREDHRRVA